MSTLLEEPGILKHVRGQEFPDNLEGKINAITNVVNSELKTVTFLHLDGSSANGSAILEKVKDTLGAKSKIVGSREFLAYCRNSFMPFGIVEEEITRDKKKIRDVRYKISDEGKEYAVPFGVFSLKWAVDNEMSLYSVLGSSNSRSELKPPLARIKILSSLRNVDNLREIDLVRLLGLNKNSVCRHLKSLEKIGFLTYESIPEIHKNKGNATYGFVKDGEFDIVDGCVTLTNQVYDFMREFGEGDCNVISEHLGHRGIGMIGKILSSLEKKGILSYTGKFRVNKSFSSTNLTEKGRDFVDNYIYVLEDSFSDGKLLRELQNEADEFLFDGDRCRDYMAEGIDLYRNVSPRINFRKSEETKSLIVDYVSRNPGARPVEISKYLGDSKVNQSIKHLVGSGVLKRRKLDRKNKNAVGYFLRD